LPEDGIRGGPMFKKIMHKLLANALFWIFVILGGMVAFILSFEKYAGFQVDKFYKIF
jgi:hypothetical protein